jgi:hypothetical protein
MAESGSKKKNRGIIIGAIVGAAVIVIAVIVCVCVFMKGRINSIEDFKAAITDQRAINCLITQRDVGEFTLQTSKGFDKVRIIATEDGQTQNLLAIRGDATYFWGEDGTGYRMSDFSVVDDFINEITRAADEDEEEEADEDYTFECSSPKKADFGIPDDIEFIDLNGEE